MTYLYKIYKGKATQKQIDYAKSVDIKLQEDRDEFDAKLLSVNFDLDKLAELLQQEQLEKKEQMLQQKELENNAQKEQNEQEIQQMQNQFAQSLDAFHG